MKKTIFRKIKFLSNIAIITIAILLSVLVVKQFLFPSVNSADSSAEANIKSDKVIVNLIGKTMPTQDVDWKKSKKNLVLYISSNCHFCTESSPFYQELVEESANGKFNISVILPQPLDEGREFLKKMNVKFENIYQNRLDTIGVKVTPTLLLVDDLGIITASWTGKLSPTREEDVMKKLEIY